jgi:hypothetical protein
MLAMLAILAMQPVAPLAPFVLDRNGEAGRTSVGPVYTETVIMNLRRILQYGSAAALLAVATVVPAHAQVTRVESGRQAIGFNLGYFAAKGFDSRVDEDVLLANLSQGQLSLAFDIDDFNGATFGGEWLIGLNDYLEAGVARVICCSVSCVQRW